VPPGPGPSSYLAPEPRLTSGEPWFLAGGSDTHRIDRDGWTIRSTDGSRAAHIEHTIAVTPDGPRILTTP
jgi:methionyl aminopeptidase